MFANRLGESRHVNTRVTGGGGGGGGPRGRTGVEGWYRAREMGLGEGGGNRAGGQG